MEKSLLGMVMVSIIVVCWVAMASPAAGQIPPGYEVVKITDDPDDYSYRPQINNCGEVVFSLRIDQSEPGEEMFLYDNGRLIRLTDNDTADVAGDINDEGTIVWTQGADGFGGGTIVMYRDGKLTEIGPGHRPTINNLRHVGWNLFTSAPCANPSAVFLYDGETVQQITGTADGLSNQAVEINDADQLTWTRFDLCVNPWASEIMLYSDGIVEPLTVDQIQPASARINDVGQVVWWSEDPDDSHEFVELWEGGGPPVTLIDPGTGELGINNPPTIGKPAEVVFLRRREDGWLQIWLYRDGEVLQVTDNPFPNYAVDINDAGELVWEAKRFPESDVYFLRRIRTGEADFDGDIDLDDFGVFWDCMTGPGDYDHLCACRFLDLDHDRDVDMADYVIFQTVFTGEGS